MRIIQTIIVLSLFCIIVAGCKKKEESNPVDNNAGQGIAITVSSGTTPTYSWTGGNVMSLSIVRTASPATIVWGLTSPMQNGIASPITHGTGASGATIAETGTSEKASLTAGVQYRVTLTRLDGTTGFKEFTP